MTERSSNTIPANAEDIASPPEKTARQVIVSMLLRATGGMLILSSIVIGTALRWQTAISESLWLDELHSGWVVGDTFAEVWLRSAEGNQTPLYFWVTWFCQKGMGESELSLRIVSIASSVLLILIAAVVVYRFSKSIGGSLLTVILLAFADPFLYYGTEARPYALLQCLSLIQILCFWRFLFHSVPTCIPGIRDRPVDRETRDGLPLFAITFFVLTSVALAYTHYTAILILLPELAFAIFWICSCRIAGSAHEKLKPIRWGMLLWAVGVIIVGCLPLLQNSAVVIERRENWASVADLGRFLNQQFWPSLVWLIIPTCLLAWLEFGRSTRTFSNESNGANASPDACSAEAGMCNRTRLFSWLVVAWGGGVVLSIFIIHCLGIAPLAMSRYVAIGVVAGPVLSGLIFARFTTLKSRVILFVVLTAFNLIGSLQVSRPGPDHRVVFYSGIANWAFTSIRDNRPALMRNETWFQAITELNRDQTRSTFPLFLFGAVIEDEAAFEQRSHRFQQYLQFPVRSLYQVQPSDRYIFAGPTLGQPHFADNELDQAIAAGGAWLLIRHNNEVVISEIEDELVERLSEQVGLKRAELTIEPLRFRAPQSFVVLVLVEIPHQ